LFEWKIKKSFCPSNNDIAAPSALTKKQYKKKMYTQQKKAWTYQFYKRLDGKEGIDKRGTLLLVSDSISSVLMKRIVKPNKPNHRKNMP